MLGLQHFSPPSDEGGAEGRGGGREKRDKSINKAFFDYPQSPMTLKKSLPQSAMQTAADGGGPLCHFVPSPHTVGSHPRQREPNETPTFAKEPSFAKVGGYGLSRSFYRIPPPPFGGPPPFRQGRLIQPKVPSTL